SIEMNQTAHISLHHIVKKLSTSFPARFRYFRLRCRFPGPVRVVSAAPLGVSASVRAYLGNPETGRKRKNAV
ncbi:MAG TPA: hypothetical protein PLG62_09585, partial [Pararhodobacter sp.]|uniref:hypothetical protein n=1 Tax=Pararhodobacter sp. TaxID=2127056 RepID=UPI002BCCCD15